MHHPFTSPVLEDMQYIHKDKARVKSRAYDLVLNGSEIGGGSIRIHDSKVQKEVFDSLGLSEREADQKFGFLLKALQFAPPHGGIAFGIDRWAMIMAGKSSIREVIAFPKNQEAKDLMLDSPSEVAGDQLEELGVFLYEE
jgi:aspartyl-tRNA synthetase